MIESSLRCRAIQFALVVVALVLLSGCRDRSQDVAAIKKTYADFMTSMTQREFATATNYLAHELVDLPDPEGFLKECSGITNGGNHLTSDAWVRFNHSNAAFLFLGKPPTTGFGFVREANGWKLTAEVLPVKGFD